MVLVCHSSQLHGICTTSIDKKWEMVVKDKCLYAQTLVVCRVALSGLVTLCTTKFVASTLRFSHRVSHLNSKASLLLVAKTFDLSALAIVRLIIDDIVITVSSMV